MATQKELYARIAETLIEKIRSGTAPWQKPWSAVQDAPVNGTTGKRYRGGNMMWLMAQEREDPRWMTYKQAQSIGAQVRKGEKGTPVIYWKFEEERTVKDENGQEKKVTTRLERPRSFTSTVFNAEQIDGLPPLETPEKSWEPVQRAEDILTASGAHIEHKAGNRAFYRSSEDKIVLPRQEQFHSADGYYSTALHELGHWTGHTSRLNREVGRNPFGSFEYAREELRAEIASMMLGREVGLSGREDDSHAAYVENWCQILQEDPREIFRAASDAEKIMDFVLTLEREKTLEQAPEQVRGEAVQEVDTRTLTQDQREHFIAGWLSAGGLDFDFNTKAPRACPWEHENSVVSVVGQSPYEWGKSWWEQNREAMQEKARQFSADSVKPWREGFPILFSHTSIAALKKHPDYTAAKEHGDMEAARRLVSDLIKPDRVKQLATLYPDAIVVPVVEKEAGDNAISRTLAEYIADKGNFRLESKIVDVSSSTHTGEGMVSRLLARKKFQGPVVAGGKYLMVDDVFTQGGTFHELRHHLANNGADAVAAVSLAFSRHGNKLAIQQETINNLTERFDREELEALLRDNDISGSIEALTENEGRSLLRFKSLESLRLRINEATLSGGSCQETRAEYAQSAGTGRVSGAEREDKRPAASAQKTPHYQTRLNLALFGTAAFDVVPPTRDDLLSVFPYATIESSGDTHVVTAGNASFSIQFVDHITPDETAFELAYGRAFGPDDGIKGETAQGSIRVSSFGDKNTIRHETYHLLEDMGFVTAQEQKILDSAVQRAVSQGREGFTGGLSPAERRALYVEQALSRREFDRQTPEGQVVQKIADVVDAFVNLAHRTERGIFRDMEHGRLFERTLDPVPGPTEVHYQTARQYLDVPYEEKDAAKELGAKWDRQERLWYMPPGANLEDVQKWMPKEAEKEQQPQQPAQKNEPRQYLAVPYEEKDAAKELGAKWDAEAKSWYVGPDADMTRLQNWLPQNNAEEQAPALDPRQEFAQALEQMGFVLKDGHPVMNGKSHRLAVGDDKQGERSGFYVGHLDGRPAGYAKNNRSGEEIRWKSESKILNPEDKAVFQARSAEKLQARAEELEATHRRTAQRVLHQLGGMTAATEPTPYMQAKGLGVPGGGVYLGKDGTTCLPAQDVDGKVWTMQYIQPDGTKRFASGGKKEGCFHPVGGSRGMDEVLKAPAIVIAEGYATAASLAKELGFATIAAFDSGNVVHVAEAFREKYPEKPILIAGDDDRHLPTNPGRTKAEEAAEKVGGLAIFPIFTPEEKGREFTDFNDLTRSELGPDAIRRQVQPELNRAVAKRQAWVQQQRMSQNKQQGVTR